MLNRGGEGAAAERRGLAGQGDGAAFCIRRPAYLCRPSLSPYTSLYGRTQDDPPHRGSGEEIQGTHGGEPRLHQRATRRDRRAARAQRRGQDNDLLHDRRAGHP